MKIAIIGSRGYPYVYSGYETLVKELAERLVQEGLAVTVYCHKHLFKERPKEVNGVRLVYVPTLAGKSLSQLSNSSQAMLHAAFSGYDVVLVVNVANGFFGFIPRIFGKKTLINVDGLEWLRPKWKGLGAKFFYWAAKAAPYCYNEIITDSVEMEKIYQQQFRTSSTVIAYGANPRFSQKPELIEKWDLESQGYYLIVGRLIPDNNADLLVREFMASNSTKKLVIVGDVPYQDEYARNIKEKAEKDPRLLFTGYVTDQQELAELYHHAFAYLHGHEFGGTNPTMLKALAYGAAILALETVFNREMLDGDRHGLFFDKSEGALSQLFAQVEAAPEQLTHFRNIARERIKQHYTWEKITAQYIALFEKVTKK